jgi:hypothetical protein
MELKCGRKRGKACRESAFLHCPVHQHKTPNTSVICKPAYRGPQSTGVASLVWTAPALHTRCPGGAFVQWFCNVFPGHKAPISSNQPWPDRFLIQARQRMYVRLGIFAKDSKAISTWGIAANQICHFLSRHCDAIEYFQNMYNEWQTTSR